MRGPRLSFLRDIANPFREEEAMNSEEKLVKGKGSKSFLQEIFFSSGKFRFLYDYLYPHFSFFVFPP
jgi:hypothetical protein